MVWPAKARGEASIRHGNEGVILVKAYPHAIAADALRRIRFVIAMGKHADAAFACVAQAMGVQMPMELPAQGSDEVLFWQIGAPERPIWVKVSEPASVHRLQPGKHAFCDAGPIRSFARVLRDGVVRRAVSKLPVRGEVDADGPAKSRPTRRQR
ncbi:hypothetical protein [Jiella pacifica]|uniref:Uncharacterized protein n=1 Tax=Jiella pacifica TaxID=2696469 RepID=A0A6N9T2Q9_9HYPH|nr:hypothetical protein [Jiella pacifica]NDW05481.1 hypothetical protein [Jiella pacifica]